MKRRILAGILGLCIIAYTGVTPVLANNLELIDTNDSYGDIEELSVENMIVRDIETEEYDININRNVNSQVSKLDLPEEVLDSLEESIEVAKESETEGEVKLTIETVEIGQPFMSNLKGKSGWGNIISEKNFSAKNYSIELTNGSTGFQYIKKGATSKDVADTVSAVAFTAVGYSNTVAAGTVSLISSFSSCYNAFCNAMNTTVKVGTAQDYLQVKLLYELTKNLTYVKLSDSSVYKYALMTKKIKIKSEYTEQYYVKSGKDPYQTCNNANKTVTSPSFAYPYTNAYKCAKLGIIYEENVKWKVSNATFLFTDN